MMHKRQLALMLCLALCIHLHSYRERKQSPKFILKYKLLVGLLSCSGDTYKHMNAHARARTHTHTMRKVSTRGTKEQIYSLDPTPSCWGTLPLVSCRAGPGCSSASTPASSWRLLLLISSVCPLLWGQVYRTVVIQIIGAKPNQANTL